MKRIFIVGFIFLLLIQVITVSPLFAQDATPSSITKVSYDMPYPGLLPDNPLYFFKTLRDRIVSFLIADSRKRVEFDLLNADKRLSAGVALINKGKQQLGITTISKGNNYFHEALQALQKAKSQGQDISLLVPRLRDASAKHEELLKEVEKTIVKDQQSAFKQELSRIQGFRKEVASYLPK